MEQVEVSIIPAEEKHLNSITALTRQFFPYTGFTFETIKQRLVEDNIFYFVALLEGNIVGFTDIEIQDDRNAKILGLAVVKEMQGKGIGRRLLEHCIRFAREKNCPNTFLLVAEDNTAAQKLYEEYGFVRKGVLDRQLGGKTVLLYEKTLSG
ncbi:MAG TPA: GNAT family N-acetyltransferase [Candidatus Norongarragalinales archaeon]|nr:GNAT family N-acetyltransferase [Candidatus Norongarragalinales archaeon]